MWGEGEEGHRAAHYMSANCVIFTYYTGEVSKALDTHFTASLSPAARDPLPLSARWGEDRVSKIWQHQGKLLGYWKKIWTETFTVLYLSQITDISDKNYAYLESLVYF